MKRKAKTYGCRCSRKRTSEFAQDNKTRRFPHENALLNTLFENCRIVRKMERLTRAKSGYVGNQLMVNPEFQTLMQKYENLI